MRKSLIFLTIFSITIFMFFSCKKNPTKSETGEWNISDIGGPIEVNVSGSLKTPKISWEDGRNNTCWIILVNSSSDEDMWKIEGSLYSPVTYGNVPEGATEKWNVKSLKSGIEYTIYVMWSTFSIGSGWGLVDIVYE